MPDAVLFDLDGVPMDPEQPWNAAKEALVREAGGRRRDDAPTAATVGGVVEVPPALVEQVAAGEG